MLLRILSRNSHSSFGLEVVNFLIPTVHICMFVDGFSRVVDLSYKISLSQILFNF